MSVESQAEINPLRLLIDQISNFLLYSDVLTIDELCLKFNELNESLLLNRKLIQSFVNILIQRGLVYFETLDSSDYFGLSVCETLELN